MTDLPIVDYFGFKFKTLFDENNTPWVMAREAAEALGFDDPAEAIRDCCQNVRKLYYCESMPDYIPAQGIEIIPESDLYNLILNSNQPQALAFQAWVEDMVIPSIVKTGGYLMGQEEMTEDELIERALSIAQSKVQRLKIKIKEESDEQKSHS